MTDSIRVAQDIGLKVRESANILILAPSPHPTDINICTDLLAVRPPEEVNIWCLAITLSPEERIWHWHNRRGSLPTRFKIVTTGSPFPESEQVVSQDEKPLESPEVIRSDDPGNLTKIGVEFTEALTEWQDTPERTMICIHSVTALIQYVEFSKIFKFLHKLKTEVEQTNAVAHYHMDPSAHEATTVGKIKQLFDTVVEVEPDDSWHVMTREFEAHGDGAIPTLDALDTEPLVDE